jgi:phosphatidylglycerophosphatase A
MSPPAPTGRFAWSHPAHFIALGLGSGLIPFAPGTVGTLLAIPVFYALAFVLSPRAMLLACAVMFVIGVWACGRTGRDLGAEDHGSMNWDELVAFVFVLTFVPLSLKWNAAAFVLFRFFDIVKPPPVSTVDRLVGGGLGVMLDDFVAAAYTLLLLALSMWLTKGGGWEVWMSSKRWLFGSG